MRRACDVIAQNDELLEGREENVVCGHAVCFIFDPDRRNVFALCRSKEVKPMQKPPEIAFRGVSKTDEIDRLIRSKIGKLEELHPNLISCDVVVERPQKHQQTGSPYRVRIALGVPPGHEVVVRHDPVDSEMHTPLDTVIREAFRTARRRLESLKGRQSGDVKVHPEQQTQAVVEKIFREEGYGFLRTVEGEQIYFHRNAVTEHDFDRLERGTGVRYVATLGEKGPQASTVEIIDKPGGHSRSKG